MSEPYTLAQFAADLKTIAAAGDVPQILDRLCPLAQRIAVSPDLSERMEKSRDAAEDIHFQLLHEESDRSFAVVLLSLPAGRGSPPHNHGTWGIVVGVEGREINTFWSRTDKHARPGYARLEQESEQDVGRGDVLTLLPDTIHSVHNETDEVSVSLHVYGRYVEPAERLQFDIGKKTAAPWSVTQSWQAHPSDRRIGRR